MKNTFYLLSLGCAKNEVDAEAMSSILRRQGFNIVENPLDAEFIIINTCGFIQSAKTEAIEAILDLADSKQARLDQGLSAFLVVTGCLSQRYPQEIYENLPEVDLVLGTGEYHLIAEALTALLRGEWQGHLPMGRGSLEHLKERHMPSRDRFYAYLKISEGCSNACAFCAIPGIRGGQNSRPIEDIVDEAKYYGELGFKELVIVAQDTTRYGSDLYGKNSLVDLLKELVKHEDIPPLRLMYVYGDSFSDELIDLMANEDKIFPYLDMPIQHASNKILQAMRRKETKEYMRDLIGRLRQAMPDLVLRTTVMVGFPGETEEDFQELLDFIQEIKFERLGCFVFCPEEGTLAAKYPDQVDSNIAQARYNKIMETQAKISLEANQKRINQEYPVLIESYETGSPFYLGRTYAEAPEVDPQIYVLAQDPDITLGQVYSCKMVEADDYTLTCLTQNHTESV